nr:hypothetical protein [Pedobacter kyonggii]
MIKKIIEIRKIKACIMVGFDEINIHLRPEILPADFASGLMPKAGIFIDFSCLVTLYILDYDCDQELLVKLNES